MTTNRSSDSSPAEATTLETISVEQLAGASGGYYGGYEPSRPCGQVPPQAAPSYTVQPGDNLTNIAKEYGHSLNYILGLNPQFQQNPNLIYPGQTVTTGRPPRYRPY